MRIDLLVDTDVEQMSDILETDVPTIVGHLFIFWSYADRNTSDGSLNSTDKTIDRKTLPGFAKALRAVGWLSGRDRSLILPNFIRHNGDSAKARNLEAEAKRLRRSAAKDASPSPDESDTLSDKCPTNVRPEKRREEKSIKKETDVSPPDFKDQEIQEAWELWLQSRREKRNAVKPTARKLQLAKLRKLSKADALAMLNHSTENGYTGLFGPNDSGSRKQRSRNDDNANGSADPGDFDFVGVDVG